MTQTKEQKKSFLESVELMYSLEKVYREKTTFEKKFFHFFNKDFNKIIQYIEFKKDKYRTRKIKEYKEQILLVLNNSMFSKDIENITKKWGLNKCKYPISVVSFYENNIPMSILLWENKLIYYTIKAFLKNKSYRKIYLKEFEKDIDDLLYKYDFDNIWKNSIIGFLLSGILVLPINYCRVMVQFNEYNNSPLLCIELTPNTTLKDINQRWKEIKDIKNELYPLRKKRGKTTKNIEDIIKIKNDYEERWNLVEKKCKSKKNRIKAIETLRKSEKRLKRKQSEILKRGLKRKLANLPTSIKEFEDEFGRMNKFYYL